MNRSRISSLILMGLGTLLVAGLVTAQAADSAGVIREYDVVVPPPQDHAFRAGVEHWEKCLRDHGSSQTFYVYDAETGDGSRYAVLDPHASWSDIGARSAADAACRETFEHFVVPHFTDEFSAILKVDAKVTYDPGENAPTSPLVRVVDFRIKSGKYHDFVTVAHAFSAAAEKAQWERHFVGYEVIGGGQGSPQFMIVWPGASWGDFEETPKSSGTMMLDSVYGKTATAALSHKMAHAIHEAWSSFWSYDKDLSFVPTRKK